eukprot:361151-Chlamydomonas_euryale.AAC.1
MASNPCNGWKKGWLQFGLHDQIHDVYRGMRMRGTTALCDDEMGRGSYQLHFVTFQGIHSNAHGR